MTQWRRNQAAVTIATFIGFTGFTLVMPFLPLYFEQLGVHDPAEIAIWSGVSLGVTPAITAVMAPIWARFADRFGRKLMVARSLASFVVIMSLMAFVQAPWQVLALRAIQGLFAGYGPIAMAMAAESAPPEQVATAIGWVQTRAAARAGARSGRSAARWRRRSVSATRSSCPRRSICSRCSCARRLSAEPASAATGDAAAPAGVTTFARFRRVPHFRALHGHRASACSSSIGASGRCCRCICVEIGAGVTVMPFLAA